MKNIDNQIELNNQIDFFTESLCNLIDALVEAEENENYEECGQIRDLIIKHIDYNAITINNIGCDISLEEIKMHLTYQYDRILEGTRNEIIY